MQQILNETKGTQKTADPAAEQEAVKDQNAEHIIGKPGIAVCQSVLQRAQRAGGGGTGAGIAVQAPLH